jgi:transcription elongation factor Elf1
MDEPRDGTVPQAWHTYRCPVCGHTGEVRLPGASEGRVSCTHCSTHLEVTVTAPDRDAAAVKVASRWRRNR